MPKTLAKLLVIALVPINYDHAMFAAGDEFEINEAEAPQLLEVNAIKMKEEEAVDDTVIGDDADLDALAAAQVQAAADAKMVAAAKAAAAKTAVPKAAVKK